MNCLFLNLSLSQKHEREVLAVVEKSRQTKQRRRRDEGMMEQKRGKKQEEEEGVYKAMGASLSEGWLLLLRLLERRQEVLQLASDFYCRTHEVFISNFNAQLHSHFEPLKHKVSSSVAFI